MQDIKENSYDFNHPKRGFAILIINSNFDNQSELPYADEDRKRMIDIFSSLRFEIKLLENLDSETLLTELKEIRNQIEEDCDCLACVIRSHGAEVEIYEKVHSSSTNPRQHVTYTKDRFVTTNDILELFNDDCCLNLGGKPKIFFIQACRCTFVIDEEKIVDKGVQIVVKEETQNEGKEKKPSTPYTHGLEENETELKQEYDFCLIPCLEDYLVMFSSSSERLSWSDEGIGSWLMFSLNEILSPLLKTNQSIDLLQSLTDVCRTMGNKLETWHDTIPAYQYSKSAATIHHMLTKDILFKPDVIINIS